MPPLSDKSSSDRTFDLGRLWHAARLAGAAGDRTAFAENYQQTRLLGGRLTADPALFAAQWVACADFAFDTADHVRGFAVLDQAARQGLIDTALLEFYEPVRQLAAAHSQAFSHARRHLEAVLNDHPLPEPPPARLQGWLRLFNPASRVPAYALKAWLAVASNFFAAAQARGERCGLLPDYLAPFAGQPARRTLSWHTTGQAPGLLHCKPADLPPYLVLDKSGYAGWSSLADKRLSDLPLPASEIAEAFFMQHRAEIIGGNQSKLAQKPLGVPAPLPPDYVFVPLQVATDRTQELARVPMLDMLDIVIERFRGTPTRVVVKRHPLCDSAATAQRLRELAAAGDIIDRDDSIHYLIAGSRAVITVNSGVGSEAIVHLKPIYSFGAADYGTIAHAVRDAADFTALTTPIRPAVPFAEYPRFLHYYRTRFMIDLRQPEALRQALAQFLA